MNYTHDDTDAKFYESVYDVLVEKAEASNRDAWQKETFVQYFTQVEHPGIEFRFCGNLGFGGKFYRNSGRVWVSCYPEDRSKKRDKILREINARIAILVENHKPNLSKY